jgi:hypothetical protein
MSEHHNNSNFWAMLEDVKYLESLNYEILDYARNMIVWILEVSEKYNVPLEEIERAERLCLKAGRLLERRYRPPTNQEQPEKTTKDGTEPPK